MTLLLLAAFLAPADAPKPVHAMTSSSLASERGNIRQLAFDADAESYFASAKNPGATDQFTLTFDTPVKLKAASVATGRPDGADALAGGELEVSADGTKFEKLAAFTSGKAAFAGPARSVKAVRVRPGELQHPLVIREFTIDSEPKLAAFRYPVEFALDVSKAPEMQEWGEKAVAICEKQYPMICDELTSPGYTPPTRIRMVFDPEYKGIAAAGGNRIVASPSYFKGHRDDFGAMVHETAHCVQGYRARRLPGWLVEGIADYVRYWKYEPKKARKPRPERARYDGSYGTTAAFLQFVSEKYDPKAVLKLNELLRTDKYEPAVWKTLTGKTVEELNQEWRQSLGK